MLQSWDDSLENNTFLAFTKIILVLVLGNNIDITLGTTSDNLVSTRHHLKTALTTLGHQLDTTSEQLGDNFGTTWRKLCDNFETTFRQL